MRTVLQLEPMISRAVLRSMSRLTVLPRVGVIQQWLQVNLDILIMEILKSHPGVNLQHSVIYVCIEKLYLYRNVNH